MEESHSLSHPTAATAPSTRVLVVDDDATVRFLAVEALAPAGFEVSVAQSGEAALSRLKSAGADVVLLDVTMPGIDGFETCRRLRELPATADVPIVMITGRDDFDAIRNAYDAGATDFLTKPINWLILEQRVRYMLKASNAFHRVQKTANELARKTQELESARRAAVESSRVKSEILANVSHELKTPLNGILGMTWLTLETELTDEQREYLQTSVSCAEALLRIVNDLVDSAQIEAGRLALAVEPFDIRDVMQEATELLRPSADAKGLVLSLDIHPEVPAVTCGDAGRLRQVLVNLIGNAVKFTETGTVSVVAESGDRSADGESVRFSVVDTGIGIPDEARSRIFEVFHQLDGSTTRKFGGAGLGLPIAAKFIELMGGEISVESKQGRGSDFHFTARFPSQSAAKPLARTGSTGETY